MLDSYIKLALAGCIPPLASVALYLLGKTAPARRFSKGLRQTICGIVFGLIAVLGTEWGIPLKDAMVNCRDAAPLCAGLFFGAPAGILAGVIGGVERWFSVLWGVGTYTRLACSVATVFAGVFAALLRKFLFSGKAPRPLHASFAAFIVETFHLSLIFLTNMGDARHAAQVIRECLVPMLSANTLSVLVAGVALSLLNGRFREEKGQKPTLSSLMQRGLMILSALCFALSTFFLLNLQSNVADEETKNSLQQSLNDVKTQIQAATDAHMLTIARAIADDGGQSKLRHLRTVYDVCEIDYIDENGFITASTGATAVGKNIGDDARLQSFLALLGDTPSMVDAYSPISGNENILRKYAGVKTESGCVLIAYDAVQLQERLASSMADAVLYRHISDSGFLLVLDESGDVCSATKGVTISSIPRSDMSLYAAASLFTYTLDGQEYVCMADSADGYTIWALIPWEEAHAQQNITLIALCFVQIMVYGMMFVLIYLMLRRTVVEAIQRVNRTLSGIVKGSLNLRVEEKNSLEFSLLSGRINTTVDTLKGYIAAEKDRIEQELQVARSIQLSALPRTFPAFPARRDLDIYAFTQPARQVGGDFYDFYFTANGHFHILIADVSGKGIPAAMFMMRAKTQLKSLTEAGGPIEEVFFAANNALCEGNEADMFVTVWMADINMETGLMEYCSAGHNPPALRHPDGSFELVRTRSGFVMGGMENVRYRRQQISLQPGDRVVLYTDGVTEATNENQQLYEEKRLLDILNASAYPDVQTLSETVRQDVIAFTGTAEQFDDITLLAFDYTGPEKDREMHFDAGQIADIPDVTAFIEEELEKLSCPMRIVMQIDVAIDEIYSNIVQYAYPKGPGPVTVRFGYQPDSGVAVLTFLDEGIPYNPVKTEDPDTTLSIEDRQIGGLGVYMVKKTMDNMTYEWMDGKNILHLYKKIRDS